jgi:ubiquinone biosynthesis protein UbiJ
MPQTPGWLAAVESLLDRGIRGSAEARALAQRLEGTALRLEADGLIALRASVLGERLSLATIKPSTPQENASANATISGTPLALLELARSGSAGRTGSASARSPVQVHGDAEVANLYRQLFAAARPDAEEELSRVIGDFPARRLSQLAKQTFGWLQKTQRTAGENVAEYLQEESRDLVGKHELDEFLHGVDELRETADRVAARLVQLERRLKGRA